MKDGKLGRFEKWIFGWLQVGSGVVYILSLGYLETQWCYKYLKWLSYKHYDYDNC